MGRPPRMIVAWRRERLYTDKSYPVRRQQGDQTSMNKLSMEYQKQFASKLIFNPSVFERIDPAVKLHDETKRHPLSSSAACLNVIGSLSDTPDGLTKFLNSFGLEIDELLEFPSPVSFGDRMYHDTGYAVFEWVGPHKSPINESTGGRGQNRTSIDAFAVGKIHGKTTQILIEWKFTEGLSRPLTLGKFCGTMGIERLKRYSPILIDLKKRGEFPFDFDDEYGKSDPKSMLGLYDLSPDHLYQLLRMTLLAKTTTGMKLGEYTLEDYRIVHLAHSQNDRINTLHPEYLTLSPGLKRFSGQPLHEVWKALLSPRDREKFFSGHWDQAIHTIERNELRNYLEERYG
jgi:hypothetical protein